MTATEQRIEERLAQVRMLGNAVCSAMEDELIKMGFKDVEQLSRHLEQLDFELSKDPFDGRESLKGTWRNSKGRSEGTILFYPDGTFYAEYDVVRPHPSKRRWFVEAMTAWGRGEKITTEARLLPALM